MDALAPLFGSFTRLALDAPAGERSAPLRFEGRLVGTLQAWGEGDLALATDLVAPVAASPDRGFALRCLATIARLQATLAPIDWIGVYRVEGQELVLTAQLLVAADHLRMPVAEGICGRVAREGRAIYVPDATLEPGFVPCEFPTRSSFVAPIMAPDNRVIGIMEVDALVPNAWDPATRAAIELAARDLLRHPGI
jgi:GAF domain-containing protein